MGLDHAISASSLQTGASRGRHRPRKMVVSKRRRPPSPLTPPLRRSSRRQDGTTTPSVHPSPSEVIEVEDDEARGSTVEEEEAEASVPRRRASQDPCLRGLISDFKAAVERAFNLPLLGDALINAVKNAAKVPLNTMRIKRLPY